jgi:tRNA threonylcarbamoyladenosine biosynthesis protein TsaE
MIKEITTHSAIETKILGEKIGRRLDACTCILLGGDLGSGKTTFTQGLAKGLDITRTVSSPTFTIMKVYQGRLPLYHIDAYRLEGLDQDLGFEELIEDDGVTVIEWPDYMKDRLPEDYLRLDIKRISANGRKFTLNFKGAKYAALLEEIDL